MVKGEEPVSWGRAPLQGQRGDFPSPFDTERDAGSSPPACVSPVSVIDSQVAGHSDWTSHS